MWGWRTLVVSLTKKISSLRELDRLLTRRAEATQDYAKAVAKARQRVGDDIADFEESTVSDVWETVLASEEEAARTAAALAREMQESVHEQLSAAAAQMDVARKRIVAEGQLLVKQNQEALRALAKAKERFLAKSAEHEQLELSLHEAEAASATDPKKKVRESGAFLCLFLSLLTFSGAPHHRQSSQIWKRSLRGRWKSSKRQAPRIATPSRAQTRGRMGTAPRCPSSLRTTARVSHAAQSSCARRWQHTHRRLQRLLAATLRSLLRCSSRQRRSTSTKTLRSSRRSAKRRRLQRTFSSPL